MYVSHRGKSVAYISNYQWWRKRKDIEEMCIRLLSHETLHLIINQRVGVTASKLMDRVASYANYQDYTGLPDPDKPYVSRYKKREKNNKQKRTSFQSLMIKINLFFHLCVYNHGRT